MPPPDASIDASFLVRLIRAEFREMPGMHLTLMQAAKLWHLPIDRCASLLEALVREGFLARGCDDRFGLRSQPR